MKLELPTTNKISMAEAITLVTNSSWRQVIGQPMTGMRISRQDRYGDWAPINTGVEIVNNRPRKYGKMIPHRGDVIRIQRRGQGDRILAVV